MAMELPEELIMSILLRLPIKTLLRFTSVCKTWYDLITSSYFINIHLNLKNKNTPLLLLRGLGRSGREEKHIMFSFFFPRLKRMYSFYQDNENIDFYTQFEFPFKSQCKLFHTVVGICNGLICVFDDSTFCMKKKIILWNPFIKKAIYLPQPILNCQELYRDSKYIQGFGYDFPRNDYKVVRVYTYDYNSEIYTRAEIYRLSTRTWEDISHLALVHSIDERKDIAEYVNGCAHWIGFEHEKRYNHPYYNYIIVGFDMHTEAFRKIMLPSNLNRLGTVALVDLHSCQGSLCLIHILSYERNKFDIWFMTEYGVADSWMKRSTIDNTSLRWPHGLRNNGDILGRTNDRSLMSYHPAQNKKIGDTEKKDEYSETFVYWFSSYVGPFIESLVLLDEKANICEADERHCSEDFDCCPNCSGRNSNICPEFEFGAFLT